MPIADTLKRKFNVTEGDTIEEVINNMEASGSGSGSGGSGSGGSSLPEIVITSFGSYDESLETDVYSYTVNKTFNELKAILKTAYSETRSKAGVTEELTDEMLWSSDSYVDAKANVKVIYKYTYSNTGKTYISEHSGILTNTEIDNDGPAYEAFYDGNDNMTIMKNLHIQWYSYGPALYVSSVSSWGFNINANGFYIREDGYINGAYSSYVINNTNGEYHILATDTSSSDNSNYTH